MEKLADGLQKLSEDDLLNVVQLIHDHKSTDTYTKNDVESKPSSIPALVPCTSIETESLTTFPQTANSTSTSTHYQIISSKCCGICAPRRACYDGTAVLAPALTVGC